MTTQSQPKSHSVNDKFLNSLDILVSTDKQLSTCGCSAFLEKLNIHFDITDWTASMSLNPSILRLFNVPNRLC